MLRCLRHATDPDHLAAVTTLVASDGRRARRARALGLAWGAGHATSLFAFGVPIVLARSYLPDAAHELAETAVGVMIAALAVRLLVRWRRGGLHAGRADAARGRSLPAAYGIGLVHGMGGSAGVGVLLLASIPDHLLAVIALVVFAAGTAVCMSLASGGFGAVLASGAVARRLPVVAPALAVGSFAFGSWYALRALQAVPYVL